MPKAQLRTRRPARPDGPPLPSFDALDETHRRMLQALEQLDALAALLAQDGAAVHAQAPGLAASVCNFFNAVARAHHDAEETFVFPQLLKGGDPALLAHVRQLQQDHNWLEEDWLELEPHLQAVASGYEGNHAAFLRAALPEFSDLHHQHIALEEQVIYPEARRRSLLVGATT